MSSWKDTVYRLGMLADTDKEESWADVVENEFQPALPRHINPPAEHKTVEDGLDKYSIAQNTPTLFEAASPRIQVRLPAASIDKQVPDGTQTPRETLPPSHLSETEQAADLTAAQVSGSMEAAVAYAGAYDHPEAEEPSDSTGYPSQDTAVADYEDGTQVEEDTQCAYYGEGPQLWRPYIHDWDNHAYMTNDMDADDWQDGSRDAMMMRLGRYLEDRSRPPTEPNRRPYTFSCLPFHLDEEMERVHIFNHSWQVRPTFAQLVMTWESSQVRGRRDPDRPYRAPGPSRLAAAQSAADLLDEPEVASDAGGVAEPATAEPAQLRANEGPEEGVVSPVSDSDRSAGSGAWSGEATAESRSDAGEEAAAADDAAYDGLLELFEPVADGAAAAAGEKRRETPASAADLAGVGVGVATEATTRAEAGGWSFDLPSLAALPRPSAGQLLCVGSIATYAGFMAWRALRR